MEKWSEAGKNRIRYWNDDCGLQQNMEWRRSAEVWNIEKIKQLKGCSIDWLLTGEGNPFPDEAPKNPLLTIPWEMKLIRTSLSLCRDMIFGRLRDTGSLSVMITGIYNGVQTALDWELCYPRYENLSVISVKGIRWRVLNDGDSILVNHGENTPRDGLYVLRINENLLVKRLQIVPGGIINVISANEAYPAFEINLNDLTDDVEIIGRVEWFGRTVWVWGLKLQAVKLIYWDNSFSKAKPCLPLKGVERECRKYYIKE